jgi:DNA-binding NtrC family response regulator
MKGPLRALIVEDDEQDFELLLRALRKGGYAPLAQRVDTPQAMAEALGGRAWDIVFSDWSMPRFDALGALQVVRTNGPDLPFIIISGTVSDEIAVEALKAGAHDFLSKGKLARLIPAVERELREATVRRESSKMREQRMISDRTASVGILAAGVAHEINNPLAALIANLDLTIQEVESMFAGSAPVKPSRELLEGLVDARESAQRIREIVRNVKLFSRADEDRRIAFQIERVLASTLRMAWNQIRHRAKITEPAPSAAPGASRRGRILVVDDDPRVASALARALAPDHDVTVAALASVALNKVAGGERFDVILCDLMMPQMTGMDLHAELCRVAPDQAEKMIFLTGGAFTSNARDFLSGVPNIQIEKPFDVTALRALVGASVETVARDAQSGVMPKASVAARNRVREG